MNKYSIMHAYKYAAAALLATALCACQQEDITPNTDPNVQVIQGDETAPVTLSGMVSYQDYAVQDSSANQGLRSINHDVTGDLPSPFFEGATTTFTCIIRSTDASKPITTFNVEWKNTDSKNIELRNFPLTLKPGTDLTQGDWYMMVFYTSNGGASGQTFSFDANTGQLTVSAPATAKGSAYYDHKVLNGTRLAHDGSAIGNNYSSIPALYASAWCKLTATTNGSHVSVKMEPLTLVPQGSLIIMEDTYDSQMSAEGLAQLGDLTVRRYAPVHGAATPLDDVAMPYTVVSGSTTVVEDTKGYTYDELIDFNSTITEAPEVSFTMHESIVTAGTFHFYEQLEPANTDYTTRRGPHFFTRPGQSVEERKAELAENALLSYTDINNGKFNTYTFTNSSPVTYSFSHSKSTNVRYTRYLWVNKTRRLDAGEYVEDPNSVFYEEGVWKFVRAEFSYPTSWSIPSMAQSRHLGTSSSYSHYYIDAALVKDSYRHNYTAYYSIHPFEMSISSYPTQDTYYYGYTPNRRNYDPIFPNQGGAYRIYKSITTKFTPPTSEIRKSYEVNSLPDE